MPLLGAGLCPAGTSFCGVGTSSPAPQPNTQILPDWITGQSQGGRYINMNTGDYQFTPDGRLRGMGRVPQLVMLALTNNNHFAGLTEKGPNYHRQVSAIVANALAPLVKQKLAQLINVIINDAPNNRDGTLCTVVWKDLTTGVENKTPVGS